MNSRRDSLKKIGLGALLMGFNPLNNYAKSDLHVHQPILNDSIYLNANENPYGPSPAARTAMAESVSISNRYGWTQRAKLVSAVSKYNQVEDENVLLAAGSTEILNLVLQFAAQQSGSIISAGNTFDYWMSPANMMGLQKHKVPLTADKKYDLKSLISAIRPDTQLVYICNPNNPTGTLCDRNALVNCINEIPKNITVLVDEAYIDLSDQKSLSELVLKHENLIIAKTFSKLFGLAGARVGYAVAHASMIKKLGKLKSWSNYSISIVSTAGALASLEDQEFINKTRQLNQGAKTFITKQFESLGIKCIPSHTNFFYFSLEGYQKNFFEQLKKHNIVGTRIYEKNGKWSRITIGKMTEMKLLAKALA